MSFVTTEYLVLSTEYAVRLRCAVGPRPMVAALARRTATNGRGVDSILRFAKRTCRQAAAAAFEDTEFGPHWHVVGNPLRLLQREIVLPHEVQHASAASELRGCRFLKENVVVLGVVERVGGRFAVDDFHQPLDLSQLPQLQ